jgi:hypothetical protein
MFYHAASSQYIQEGVAFDLNGVQYPSNWLNLTSAEEKTAAGFVEVVTSGLRLDDRFYWVSESLSGNVLTITSTAKDLTALKSQWSAQVKQTAYTILLQSDWMVTKALETSTAVPAEWSTYRAAVRSTAATAIAAINVSADVPALQSAVQVTWPNNPDHVEMTDGA